MADLFRICSGKKRHVFVEGCFPWLGIHDIVGYDPEPGEAVRFCLNISGVSADRLV